jgi:hypothetical protein
MHLPHFSSKSCKERFDSSLGRGLYLAYQDTDLLKTLGRLPELFALKFWVKIVPRKQCALQTTQISIPTPAFLGWH